MPKCKETNEHHPSVGMASFSIQELLGLGKDGSSSNSSNSNSSNSSSKSEGSNSEAELSAAAKNSKHDADAKPRAASTEPEPAEDTDKDINVETLDDEENAAAEPMSVEMPRRIVHTTSSQAPQGIIRGVSRKRKRSKQAEELSDGKSDTKIKLTARKLATADCNRKI